MSDTQSIDKREQSNRSEPPTAENRNTAQLNSTKQTLTDEQKINLESLKRIMNEEKGNLVITNKHGMVNNQDGNRKK